MSEHTLELISTVAGLASAGFAFGALVYARQTIDAAANAQREAHKDALAEVAERQAEASREAADRAEQRKDEYRLERLRQVDREAATMLAGAQTAQNEVASPPNRSLLPPVIARLVVCQRVLGDLNKPPASYDDNVECFRKQIQTLVNLAEGYSGVPPDPDLLDRASVVHLSLVPLQWQSTDDDKPAESVVA
jgi:hypothetical protein